jgi:predicted DNA-binding protein
MPKKGPDKRVHVTFDDGTREILEIISEKEHRPMAEVVRRMVENWMERYEDLHWAEIASKEIGGKRIPLEEVLKGV